MKNKILALCLAAVTAMTFTACSENTGTNNGDNDALGGNNGSGSDSNAISLTVWGAEEDQALLVELVGRFKEEYSEQTFDIQIGVESEATAKDTVLKDISAAADVFAFADDQLVTLASANALANLEDISSALEAAAGKSIDDVKAANVESSVTAASWNGELYAFPMGGGNNYFLYYDSNVLSEEDVESWDSLLAAADEAGKKAGMVLASGWYNAGFFLGAGFTASLNDDGSTSLDWNGTSADGYTGVQVVEAMLKIAGNSAFMAVTDNDTSNQMASGSLCAIVSGTWDADAAEKVWGDGYAATKLPTFDIDGDEVQMGCYSGFKLIGVNALSQNVGWAAVLAEFLTNEEAQIARFDERQTAPTNSVAAANEDVTANIAIAASALQDNYGVVQSVGDSYWDPTKSLGEIIAQQQLAIGDSEAIQKALDTVVEGVSS